MPTPPVKGPAPRPASVATSKAPTVTAKSSGPHAAGPAKSAPPTKSASRPKPTTSVKPVKRAGTAGGRLTIAVLAGLAIGLVALVIYGMTGSQTPWAFDRPEAPLPSLQSKHTLY